MKAHVAVSQGLLSVDGSISTQSLLTASVDIKTSLMELSLISSDVPIVTSEIVFRNWYKGDKGESGDDGKSAYQIAVDNGFEGTEQEWVDSLKGEMDLSDYAKIEYVDAKTGMPLSRNELDDIANGVF